MVDSAYFPYTFRENQEDFIRFVQRGIERHNVCLNAPTGFGKTPGILAGLLPIAKEHGFKIIWAVRTGNETDRPIEELKVMNERLGIRVAGLSFRGKKDMCLLAREREGELDYEEVAYLCKAKGKGCRYRSNLAHGIDEGDFRGALLYSEILKLCWEREICPYDVQRALLPYADVVSLNYNYIIHEGMGWSIKKAAPFYNSFLVVDEAHNLQYAAANLNSIKITLGTLRNASREIKHFQTTRAKEIEGVIEAIDSDLRSLYLRMKEARDEDLEFDTEGFLERLSKVSDLGRDFSSIRKYGKKIQREQLERGRKPRSSLNRLGLFLENLVASLDIEGVAVIATRLRNNLEVEIWDMRAEELLRDRWEEFEAGVFCSGTLSPIPAFAETIGLDNFRGKNFPSFYDLDRVRSFIAEDLSTEGKRLGREMKARYLNALGAFIGENDANLAVFSASYRIQNAILKAGLVEKVKENGRKFFLERRGMSGDKAREVLDGFKRCADGDEKGVLCATMTGRFAEGADFPGRELEGIFLVGIPFDRMNTRTKLYLDYYKRLYGKEKGNLYAYVIPALKRASQALGRALRSREDEAVFVLGDRRYAHEGFLKILPDFVRKTAIVGCSEDFKFL
ncbi:MAG: ATP-dependent DNA helicase [Candidatus Hydrothermarchaeales archaeon]